MAGISDPFGTGVIENTQNQGGSSSTLTVNNTASYVFSGHLRDHNLGNGSLALVKGGAGKLTLSGAYSGSYTGGLTVNAGTLDYSGGVLPVCNYTVNGGTLNIGSLSQSIGTFLITGGTVDGDGTLTSNANYNVQGGQVNAVLAGPSLALTKSGTETAVLANDNTYAGLTTISAGTLQLGAGSNAGGVAGNISISSAGTLGINRSDAVTFTSKLSGTGTMIKSGTGTLAMSGSNTFSGNVALNNGTLDYSGNSILPVGNYTVNGGTLNLGSLSASIGSFQLTGGAVAGSGALTSNSTFALRAGTVNPGLAGSAVLNKSGQGTAILNGPCTYTGLTTVANGTLQLGPAAQSAVLAGGGADIQAGKIVFNYGAGADPASQIASILGTGYGDGSHPFASGQIRSSTAASVGLALGWRDVASAQAVTVMYTLYGDADLSGTVDFTDLNTVLSDYNKPGTWADGDFNYDGQVDFADLNSVLSFYNQSVPVVVDASSYNDLDGGALDALSGAGISVVPEPSSVVLLLVGLVSLLAYLRRKLR